MMPERLLAPFADEGKSVSQPFLELIPELKTETARRTWDQWGLGVQPVPTAHEVLCMATRRQTKKVLQPQCRPENGLYSWWDSGFQLEMAEQVVRRGEAAKKEKLGTS